MVNESTKNGLVYHPCAQSPKLIWPTKRDGIRRISEQEAKFAFVDALSDTSFYYSVETPTIQKYRFKDDLKNVDSTEMDELKTSMSARTDLTLYLSDQDRFYRCINMEFKAHNPVQKHIDKDIEKLVREVQDYATLGNWFHLLTNSDRETFPALFGKFERALNGTFKQLETLEHEILRVDILFCFCVIDKKSAYLRRYDRSIHSDLKAFFCLDKNGVPGSDWQIIEFHEPWGHNMELSPESQHPDRTAITPNISSSIVDDDVSSGETRPEYYKDFLRKLMEHFNDICDTNKKFKPEKCKNSDSIRVPGGTLVKIIPTAESCFVGVRDDGSGNIDYTNLPNEPPVIIRKVTFRGIKLKPDVDSIDTDPHMEDILRIFAELVAQT
jgi:hypothetical protein